MGLMQASLMQATYAIYAMYEGGECGECYGVDCWLISVIAVVILRAIPDSARARAS